MAAASETRVLRTVAAAGALLALALTAGEADAQATGTRATGIAEAVSIALQRNPDALASEIDVKVAEATRAEVGGTFYPKLHVDANVQQWNQPFAINFGGAAFTVRDAFTWQVAPSLTQPLTGLWSIYDQYKVQQLGVDVAAIKRRVTRREVAFQVVQGYYRLLEAQRLVQVAETSVTQLEAQQKQAQSLFDNGVIGKNDLLRAGLALAGARQRAIQTRGNVTLARGQIDTLLGSSPDEPFEPVPFTGEPPAVEEVSLQSAEERAVTQRLELAVIDRSIAQADHSVAFAKKKLVPQLSAVANYTHTEGSPFQQENAAFVGLFLAWDVWDWGATTGGIDEASAKLDQARVARRKVQDQVRLEARQAFVNADTAREALGVARTAVAQAEENYRIVSKKFEAAAATSFDMVDAESLLTQSRGQVETALYDLLIARAALQRATGTALPGER
jgi:outer membrane protein